MGQNITITKIKIQNFRNIKYLEEEINSDRVCVAGKNHIGKTNTVQAIYWLLTGKLLGDNSDLATIKPLTNTGANVSVELTVTDSTGVTNTIRKEYGEVWVKTRGQEVETLKGHSTNYFINDAPIATEKEFSMRVDEIMRMDELKLKCSLNPYQLIIDPLYFCKLLSWQTRRALVTQIIGEVKPENIYEANPVAKGAETILSAYRYKYDDALRVVKNNVGACDNERTALKNVIDDLTNNVVDITPDELANAENEVARLDEAIAKIKEGKVDDSKLRTIEKKIADTKIAIAEQKRSDKERYDARNKEATDTINQLSNKRLSEASNYYKHRTTISDIQNKIESIKRTIDNAQNDIQSNEKKRQSLIDEYREIKARTFDVNSQVCHTCGAMLKEEEIQKHKEEFDTKFNRDLEDNVVKGKKTKLDNERLEKEISESETELDQLQKDLEIANSELKASEEKGNAIKNEIETLKSSIEEYIEDDSIKALQSELSTLEEDRTQELFSMSQANHDVDFKIEELNKEKEQYQEIINKHIYYSSTQTRIGSKQRELAVLNKNAITKEQELIALKEYRKTELELMKSGVDKAFKGLEIQLVQDNIKEGSWDPVCKAFIKDKKTLFDNGSTSEQIVTGIAFIECLKKSLNLPDLPILFDEGETLDSETIRNLDTQAQVICAYVDNRYTVPTFKKLGGD